MNPAAIAGLAIAIAAVSLASDLFGAATAALREIAAGRPERAGDVIGEPPAERVGRFVEEIAEPLDALRGAIEEEENPK